MVSGVSSGAKMTSSLLCNNSNGPTWRSDSYHVEWNSISLIHGDNTAFNTLSEPYKRVQSQMMDFLTGATHSNKSKSWRPVDTPG